MATLDSSKKECYKKTEFFVISESLVLSKGKLVVKGYHKRNSALYLSIPFLVRWICTREVIK